MTNHRIIFPGCNFKIFFLFIFFPFFKTHGFTYQDYEKKIKNSYSIKNVIEKFPRALLESNLREFVMSGRPSRLSGTKGHEKSQNYLEEKIKTYSGSGATNKKQLFEANGKKGINFIWEKKGIEKSEEVLILSANYDTLLRDQKSHAPILQGEMPGADNNASGVAILLSMLEILDKLDLPKTVMLVFYDNEEWGAAGSKEFVKKIKNEMDLKKIVGVINLTMLGHDSKKQDLENKLNNMNIYTKNDSIFLNSLIKNADNYYSTVNFKSKEFSTDSFFPKTAENFLEEGIVALTITQNREGDLNPRYMTSNDFPETLNFTTYFNIFKYVTSAVLAWDYGIVK